MFNNTHFLLSTLIEGTCFIDVGLGHVSCFGQQESNKCNAAKAGNVLVQLDLLSWTSAITRRTKILG